jgi:hypothetical protein
MWRATLLSKKSPTAKPSLMKVTVYFFAELHADAFKRKRINE